MTDKQIIIDDCIHLNEWKHCDICEKLIKTKDSANGKKREHLLTEEDLRCDFYPNCYYKQLKAKEQECEELKEQLKRKEENYQKLLNKSNKYIHNLVDENVQDISNLTRQLDQLKAENDELKKDNSILKKILSYPKYTNENAYNELLKLSKAELIKNLIESHQHGESITQVFYRSISEENKKNKQTLAEIKEIAEPYKMTIKKICGNCKKYDDCHACCYKDINCYKYTSSKTNSCEEFTYLDEFVPNILANNILQKISEVENETRP